MKITVFSDVTSHMMVERKVGKPEVFLTILTENMSHFFVAAVLLENTNTELE